MFSPNFVVNELSQPWDKRLGVWKVPSVLFFDFIEIY